MISFPKAKINLGLYVNAKRDDGFHDLETIMVPVGLKDILEIQVLPNSKGYSTCKVTGLLESLGNENSCTQAYDLLHKDFNLPSVQMHLHKNIPTGAGLGGGSSDTAATLNMLNDLFDLKLSRSDLEKYAARIGSDDAFFINDSAKFCHGRGELLMDLPAKNETWQLVLINPGIHVSTAKAFEGVTLNPSKTNIKELWLDPVEKWKGTLVNQFEPKIFERHPEISMLKDQLYLAGAKYASMSGSGSTVFGLFSSTPNLPKFPSHYLLHLSDLQL